MEVMERIVNILNFIGKRDLYRGNAENAYSFEDKEVDHGNFLEYDLVKVQI